MGSLGAVGRCFNWAGEDVSLTFEGKRLTNYPADFALLLASYLNGAISPVLKNIIWLDISAFLQRADSKK